MSLFITSDGRYYRAHKDGIDNRVSINYTVQILDDKCITSWYNENDLKDYQLDGLTWSNPSKECNEFDPTKHTPVKSMTAKPNEAVLFNTDIFHDWDNSTSSNVRAVLTLRIENQCDIYFEDAKKILFGIN